MIGGIVGAQSAAVRATVLVGLLLAASGSGVLFDPYGEGILLARAQLASYIEAASHESAFDTTNLLAIQEDVGFPVDAIEIQPNHLPRRQLGRRELGAVPEVG